VKVSQRQVAASLVYMLIKAVSLTLESTCRLLSTKHSPIAIYYYLTMRSIWYSVIYLPSEIERWKAAGWQLQ